MQPNLNSKCVSVPVNAMQKVFALLGLFCLLALSAFAQAPGITNSPANATGVQGQNFTFRVLGTNFGGATFQWYFNDTLAGAGTNTFTVPNVGWTNVGNYYVVVGNSFGSVTSAVAFLTVTPASGVFLDFDTVGQFTNNFNARDFSGIYNGAVWGETNGLGAGGSRGLDAFRAVADEVTYNYWRSPVSVAQVGKVANASVMFKFKSPTANGRLLEVGFIADSKVVNPNLLISTVSSTNQAFYNTLNMAFLAARLNATNKPNNEVQIQLENRSYFDTLPKTTNSPSATLVPGEWYKLSLSITNNKNGVGTALTNTFLSGLTLQSMGSDGLTPGAVVSTFAAPVANVTLATNMNLFVASAFCPVDTAGVDVVDNFAVWSTDGPLSITYPPFSQTVLQGRSVTFVAAADGAPPYYFQWLKDGVAIPGANQSTLTIPAAALSDGGTYSLQVTNANYNVVSPEATLTITPDTQAPVLVSAASLDGSRIGVRFDEMVASASATVAGNYTVSGVTVTQAGLRPDGRSVELTLSAPISGTFTVSVTGVQDLAGNAISSANVSGIVMGLAAFDVTDSRGVAQATPGYSYSANDGDIDMTAGGMDLGGISDDGHLLMSAPRTGDFDIKVRVNNLTRQTLWNTTPGNDDVAKAALIARDSTNANSRSIQLAVTPRDLGNPAGLNAYVAAYRASSGATMTNFNPGTLTNTVPYPQAWMRVRRANSTLSLLRSWDGVNWTNLASTVDPSLAESMVVGLGATAHLKTDAPGLPVSVEFRNYGDTFFPGATINSVDLRPATINLKVPATFTMTSVVSVVNVPLREVQYIWQRTNSVAGGWTNVPFASSLSSNLVTETFTPGDEPDFSSWAWRCIVRVPGAPAVTSGVSRVIGYTDTNPPIITAASFPVASVSNIVVTFSKPLDIASGLNLANYRVTNSVGQDIPISSVYIMGNGPTNATVLVTLAVPLTNAIMYGVVANDILDFATPPNRAVNTWKRFDVTANATSPGKVLIEGYWTLASSANSAISSLTNHPRFLVNDYNELIYSNLFAWHMDLTTANHDDDGTRASSYFIPPSTGNYKFYIRGDDDVLLLMNTNSVNSTDPGGKVSLAYLTPWNGAYGSTPASISPAISLVGGQRYYMELLNKNGGGGDGSSVAFRAANDVNIPAATEVIGPENLELPMGAVSVASVTPSTLQVVEGDYVTFSATGIGGAAPYWTRWFKSGVLVPGSASSYSKRIGPFLCGDTNVVFQLSNSWSATRFIIPVTISPDTNKPTVISASGDGTLSRIYVKFSEGMDPVTAANPLNYTIPGLTVFGASLSGLDTVVLRTTPQEQGYTYTVNINNVKDGSCAGNLLDAVSTTFTSWVVSSGLVWREFYTDRVGGTIADLLSDPNYAAHRPSLTDVSSTASSPNGWGEHYGVVMYGYFQPPVSGVYTFFLTHDDGGQLLFSTDDSKENAVLTSLNAGCCHGAFDAAFTWSKSLVAGQRYYFEARVKEHEGGDYLSVGVRTPLDSPSMVPSSPMGGALIAAAGDPNAANTPLIGIMAQPTNAADTVENTAAKFYVTATNSAGWPMGFAWQRYNIESGTWADIPGATSSNLSLAVTCHDDGVVVRAKATVPGRIVYSSSATVHVVPDTVAPSVSVVMGDMQSNVFTVVFSEKVAASSAANIANYTFSGGLPITSAVLLADQRSVLVTVGGVIPVGIYTATVRNVTDIACVPNAMVETTSAPFNTPWPVAYGYVQAQQWLNLVPSPFFGNSWDLSFLTGDARYPLAPDLTVYTNATDWPQTSPDTENYGMRMTGVIIPSVSGNYTFRIIADDSSKLTISPYGNLSAGTVLIDAQGNCATCGGVSSKTFPMTAGYPYSFEVQFLEGTGGDYMHLYWQVPGSTVFTNIFDTNLAFTVNPDIVNLSIAKQPTNMSILEGRKASFVVQAIATVGVPAYQWQSRSSGAPDWVDIAGANSPVYNTDYVCEDVNGTEYRVIVGLSLVNGLITRTNISETAVLTVLPDEEPPTIVSMGSLDGNTIGIVFSEPIRRDAPGFLNFDNWEIFDSNILANLYVLNPDGTCVTDENGDCIPTYYNYPVSQVVMWPDTNAIYSDKIQLVLNGHYNPNVSGPFSVHCYYAVDTACRENAIDSIGESTPIGLNLVDIWQPQPAGSAFVGNSNMVQVTAGGADIWGQGDQFTYLYKQVNGDFDARVTVLGLPYPPAPAPNTWSKAGLMLRGHILGTDGVETNSWSGTATNSMMAYVVATPTNGQRVFSSGIRQMVNGSAVDMGTNRFLPEFPAQIRMVREGDFITTYCWSYLTNVVNDTNTQVSTTNVLGPMWVISGVAQTTNWPSLMYLGIATTSHAQSNGVNAAYQDFVLMERPTITLQPVGLTIRGGESASFTVAAIGPAEAEPLRYQWRLNGVAIPGANSSTYTVTNAGAVDLGNYSCEVRNAAGAVTSDNAVLVIQLPPLILVQPADQVADCFGSATFSVLATNNAEGTMTYQWRLNGAGLPGETSPTLTVNYLAVDTAGPYSVAIANSLGVTISSNASVTLVDTAAPVILCPGNMVSECGAVNFQVGATNSCGYSVMVNCTPASGSAFPLGETTVECHTLNPVGPSAQCSFRVTVVDTVAPVFANCPAAITTTNTVVTWPAVTATDGCNGAVTVSCTPTNGSTFSVGTHTVVCQATDASNNSSTCSFAVTVQGEGGQIRLSIVSQGTDVMVSWPTSPEGYRLEYTLSLGAEPARNWQPYAGAVSTNGNTISATISATSTMFFRLSK